MDGSDGPDGGQGERSGEFRRFFPPHAFPLGAGGTGRYKTANVARDQPVPRLDYFRLTVRRGTLRSAAEDWNDRMANPLEFLTQVRAEAAKVTWPTRRETLITTALVIVMVILASIFFVSVDQALRMIVTFLLSLVH